MKIYPLDKIVLNVQNNAVRFLNGLTSNAMEQPQNAFLNIHGRIIAAFDQVTISEEQVLLVVQKAFQNEVLEHLGKFARIGGVIVESRGDRVYFDLTGEYSPEPAEYAIPQRSGKVILTSKILDQTVSDEEFTLFRVKNRIPVQGIDYRDEFVLNVDEERLVSFAKGCFLGQEPVSKVHNRSKPTWKLAVCFEDELDDERKEKITSKVRDPQSGRTLGFVFVKNS